MRHHLLISQGSKLFWVLNYYHKFLPNLSVVLSPLHCLLRKDEIWKGTQEQENSFIQAKGLLHSFLLVHYDPSKPLIISCDASPYRLGAILSLEMDDEPKMPIAFASRTLAPAEKQYCHLE
uniref:Reverse transcriptase/retrotransposon-derived protein RNase H-like domain-containing protein n=1 Tax=Amphimedon queenslandica TaxID=400682 RepID=A0A1X7UY58_AMPQE